MDLLERNILKFLYKVVLNHIGTMLNQTIQPTKKKSLPTTSLPLYSFIFAGPLKLTWSSNPSPSSTAVINTTLDERSSNAWEPKWYKKV